jgi:hypothetical protein
MLNIFFHLVISKQIHRAFDLGNEHDVTGCDEGPISIKQPLFENHRVSPVTYLAVALKMFGHVDDGDSMSK